MARLAEKEAAMDTGSQLRSTHSEHSVTSGEWCPIDRAMMEFLRLCDNGKSHELDEFCSHYPEPLRDRIRLACQNYLEVRKALDADTVNNNIMGVCGRTRLGDFEIVRELGRGSMGVVYLATQQSLKRQVALKVLPIHLLSSDRHMARLRREAVAAAKLEHPGIEKIYAIEEEAGTPYLVMEYIDGPNLQDTLRAHRGDSAERCGSATTTELPPPNSDRYFEFVADLIAQVAEALQCAHETGVIHRDIKPQNILIDRRGNARIVDFGLAKDLDESALTRTGSQVGTPYYMSPEQALPGGRPLDHRTDIFSLGIVLYEMLAHRRPFGGCSLSEVALAISLAQPPTPRRVNRRVPPALEVLCLRAMSKNPDNRFSSAGELAEELRRFLRSEPIESRAPSLLTRVYRAIQRRLAPLSERIFQLSAAYREIVDRGTFTGSDDPGFDLSSKTSLSAL